jgi:hypothetical protein
MGANGSSEKSTDVGTIGGDGNCSGGAPGRVKDDNKRKAPFTPEEFKAFSKTVATMLNENPNTDLASDEAFIAWTKEHFPDPKKGTTLTPDKGAQLTICRQLSQIINDAGYEVTQEEGKKGCANFITKVLTNQIEKVKETVDGGAEDVKGSIRNLHIVLRFIEQAKGRIREHVSRNELTNSEEIDTLLRLVDDMLKIYKQQLVQLAAITNNVVVPYEEGVVELIKNNSDFESFVNKLKNAAPGTPEWSDRLSYALAGIPNAHDFTLRTKKAADTINMSLADIKNSSSLNNLRMAIENAKDKMGSELSKSELTKIIKAEQSMLKAYSQKELLEISGGSHDSENLSGGGYSLPPVGGGMENMTTTGGLPSVRQRVKTQTFTRKTMLRSFNAKAKILFEKLLKDVFLMSKGLGTAVPLSDDLSRFVHTFDQLGSIYKSGIEYALTGYYTHAGAIEERERFIGQLQSVVSTLNPLASNEHFRSIKECLVELQKHIDTYTDRINVHELPNIQRSYKGAAEHGGMEDRARNAIDDEKEQTNTSGGALSQAALTLRNVRRTLKHFYAVAKMRANLRKVTEMAPTYNKDYESIMGDAMSKCIDEVKNDWNKFTKALEQKSENTESFYNTMHLGPVYNTINVQGDLKSWDKSNIKKMKKDMVDAKIGLYRALQAIDLYLMRFTDGVNANPDDIKKVASILESVEIVAEWFNERSGDSVAALFEYMPFALVGFEAVDGGLARDSKMVDQKTGRLTKGATTHYYKQVSDEISKTTRFQPTLGKFNKDTSKSMPGNPYLVMTPQRANAAREFARKTTERMLALKNIVAAFAYLGDKLGGESVTSKMKSMMTPAQIYKALNTYLYTSAFVMGWDGYSDAPGGTTNEHRFSFEYLKVDNTGAIPGVVNGINLLTTGLTGAAAGGGANINSGEISNIKPPGGAHNNIHIGVASFATAADLAQHTPAGAGTVLASHIAHTATANTHAASAAIAALVGAHPHNWKNMCVASAAANAAIAKSYPTTHPTTGDADMAAPDAPIFAKCAFGCAMNSITVPNTFALTRANGVKTIGGWHNEFEQTDQLFVHAIKALVAKVFTVSGLYNMFNYKTRNDHIMSSARFVLGGDSSAANAPPSHVPIVHDDAVELYIRLPLLAEFYADVFSLDTLSGTGPNNPYTTNDGLAIGLIPEMDQMWVGLMRLAFERPRGAAGIVTKNYAANMIKAVNGIYNAYKSKGKSNLVSTIVIDLIADVNSKFGIMKRAEVELWKEREGARRAEVSYPDDDGELRNFDILNEDEESGQNGVLPSDRFGRVAYSGSVPRNEFKLSFIKAISNFRTKIDRKIRDAVYGRPNTTAEPGNTSELMGRVHGIPNFHDQVRITKDSMKAAPDAEARFNEIFRTISGIDSATKRAEEVYVMFHETVVAPLAVLSGVHRMLKVFEDTVWYNCIGAAYSAMEEGVKEPTSSMFVAFRNNVSAPRAVDRAAGGANPIDGNCEISNLLRPLLPLEYRDANTVNNIANSVIRPEESTIPAGMCGLPQTMSKAALCSYVWATTANNLSTFSTTYMLACLWHEKCFKALTQLMMAHSADLGGMATVEVSGQKIVIDHSRLQQFCEDTISFVRKAINKFRGNIDPAILRDYEGTNKAGSIGWIQNNLMDKMFNSNEGGLTAAVKQVADSFNVFRGVKPNGSGRAFVHDLNLVSTDPAFPNNFKNTLSVSAVARASPTVAMALGTHVGCGTKKPDVAWSFDSVLSEMSYYNPNTMNSRNMMSGSVFNNYNQPPNVTQSRARAGSPFFTGARPVSTKDDDLIFALRVAASGSTARGQRVYSNTRFMARWQVYVQDGGFRADRTTRRYSTIDSDISDTDVRGHINTAATMTDDGEGLVMKFNEVLGQYLSQFWDRSATKIYQPLIANFANGAAVKSVMESRGWPDLYTPNLSPVNGRVYINSMGTQNGGAASQINPNAAYAHDGNDLYLGAFVDYDRLDTFDRSWLGSNAADIGDVYIPLSWAYHLATAVKRYNIRPGAGLAAMTPVFYNIAHKYRSNNAATIVNGITATGFVGIPTPPIAAASTPYVAANDVDIGHAIPADAAAADIGGAPPPGAAARIAAALVVRESLDTINILEHAGDAIAESPRNTHMLGLLHAWIMRAVVRARNEVIRAAGSAKFMMQSEYADSIRGIFDCVLENEMAFHRDRLTNFCQLRRLISGIGTTEAHANPAFYTMNYDAINEYIESSIIEFQPENTPKAKIEENMRAIGAHLKQVLTEYRNMIFTDLTQYNAAGAVVSAVVGTGANTPMKVMQMMYIRNHNVLAPGANISLRLGVGANNTAPVMNRSFSTLSFLGYRPWQMRALLYRNNGTVVDTPAVCDAADAAAVGVAAYNNAVSIAALQAAINGLGAANRPSLNSALAKAVSMGFTDLNEIRSFITRELSFVLTKYSSFVCSVTRNAVTDGGHILSGVGIPIATSANITGNINDLPTHRGTVMPGNTGVFTDRRIGNMADKLVRAGGTFIQSNSTAMVAGPVMAGQAGHNSIYFGATPVADTFAHFSLMISDASAFSTTMATSISNNAPEADKQTEVPTTVSLGTKFGNPDEIVMASLGKAMRTMLVEQGRANTPDNLVTNMSEVPIRMKECMRANLPGFVKMFGMISNSATVLKKVMRLGIDVRRHLYSAGACEGLRAPEVNVQGRLFGIGYGDHEGKLNLARPADALAYHGRVLDKLTSCCESIIKCATGALDELNDNPLYMETHENGISDYRNTNNTAPFMPLSSALFGLKSLSGTSPREPGAMLPIHGPGGRDFEINYGTRLALNRPTIKPLLTQFPGMRDITESYNKTVPADKQISLGDMDTFVSKYVPMLRWVSNTRTAGVMAGAKPSAADPDIFGATGAVIPPYVVGNSLDATMSLTTGSDKTGSTNAVVEHTAAGRRGGGPMTITREQTQVYNIIDLNVNPININSLRREVPMINLLNYSYTFDSFAKDIIGNFEIPNPDRVTIGAAAPASMSATYLHSVINPHVRSSLDVNTASPYYSTSGVNVPGMTGKDRFVTNQIMEKALFMKPNMGGTGPIRNMDYSTVVGVPAANQLEYYQNGATAATQVPVTNHVEALTALGCMRYDTTFVRNLIFISSAHRLMRAKLSLEMTKITSPVASGPSIVSSRITEASPWEQWEQLRTD